VQHLQVKAEAAAERITQEEAVAEIKDGGTRVKTECTVRVEQKEKLGINCCQNAKDF
jgi:hypothetical protein